MLRRAGHLVGVSIALVLALALASLSATLHRTTRSVDAFYDAPSSVPSKPGQLVRSEPFTRGMPSNAEAFRILFTTTRAERTPAVASALVVVPRKRSGRLPVIAWAHGTTGVARRCAPSVMPSGLGAGAFFSLDKVLAEGWALVAPDYIGLGTNGPHPYLIGDAEARSVLDAVRAARQLQDVSLSNQTVAWGHSQGGGAALWTGQIAPTYAPDVPLAGVAALAPASDLAGFIDNLATIKGGSIFTSYIVSAYASRHPSVSVADLVRPAARTSFDETTKRCLDGTALASALTSLTTGFDMFTPQLKSELLPLLEQNTPTGPFEMPVLIAQGTKDSIVVPSVQTAYAKRLCRANEPIDFRTYAGRDHVPLVQPDSPLIPDLVTWTKTRLQGDPAPRHCPS